MKNLFVNSFLLLASCFIIYSCASNKGLSKNYYSNPNKEITKKTGISETKRAVREVDRLASQATDKLRAVGVGNDYDEKYARREAIRDAQTILAEYIENAIVEVVKEYNLNSATL